MDVLVYLVPLALGLGLLGLGGFLWSLRSGQYDDLDGAAWRAIADDEPPARPFDARGDRPEQLQRDAARTAAGPAADRA